jgi:hypothetical protein
MAPESPGSRGPESPPPRKAAPTPGLMPFVGGARLPLAFIGGGLVALAAGTAWLARESGGGLPPHLHPRVVALAHLWLPGFLLSVCLGASYQLMPVVLGTPPRSSAAMLWAHAALHGIGVSLLVTGLASGNYVWAGAGGLALALGVVWLALVTWRTFARSARRDVAAWSFPLAAAWLLATVLAGVTLAANRHAPFLPLSTLDLLRAHAHLGLVGYFLTLLQGVTFQLVPMFTLGEARRPRLALAGLISAQAGLLLLAPGLAWAWRPAIGLGVALLLAGLCGTGVALAATLRSRRRRVLDPGIKAFVLGLFFLALAAVFGGALALGWLPPDRSLPGAVSYGLLVVTGGLSLTVLGMLCKILPFLVWMKAYGPHVGRRPVPAATALASRRLEHLWLLAHAGGVALLAVGSLTGTLIATRLGGGLLGGGVLLYLLNAGRVLRHLAPRIAPAAATAATATVAATANYNSAQ